MVQISKRPVNEYILEKIFELLFSVMGNKNNKKEFFELTDDLFSTTEKIMIGKRIAIIYLYLQGFDARSISRIIKTSTATVAKFARSKDNKKGAVPILKKILLKEQISGALDDFINEIYKPGVYGVNWKSAWNRRRLRHIKKSTGF